MKNIVKISLLSTLWIIMIANTLQAQELPNIEGDNDPIRLKMSECLADIKEVTAWDEESTLESAKRLCELRQKHSEEKTRFYTAMKKLNEQFKDYTNHGFNEHLTTAIKDAKKIVDLCINLKSGFRHPHNIGLYMAPEIDITNCYSFGASIIESELYKD